MFIRLSDPSSILNGSLFITVCLVVISACAFNPAHSGVENDFIALSGAGKVIQKQPESEGGHSTVDGWVSYVPEFGLPGEKNCQGIALTTTIEAIVFLAACDSGTFYLCPRGLHSCTNEFSGPTQVSSQSYKMRSSFADNLYRLEVYPQRLVYRIQESKCFIKYPHGCLINGIGWSDVYSFEFRKN